MKFNFPRAPTVGRPILSFAQLIYQRGFPSKAYSRDDEKPGLEAYCPAVNNCFLHGA